jgi:hypothetical protein
MAMTMVIYIAIKISPSSKHALRYYKANSRGAAALFGNEYRLMSIIVFIHYGKPRSMMPSLKRVSSGQMKIGHSRLA